MTKYPSTRKSWLLWVPKSFYSDPTISVHLYLAQSNTIIVSGDILQTCIEFLDYQSLILKITMNAPPHRTLKTKLHCGQAAPSFYFPDLFSNIVYQYPQFPGFGVPNTGNI